MKIRTFVTWVLPLILLLILAILLVLSGILGRPLFSLPALGLVREEKVLSTDLFLEEIRKLETLHTLEYVHKTVFPFDFLDPAVDYRRIIDRLRTGVGSTQSLLTPREREYLAARNLAVRLGVDVGDDAAEFVVVTVIARAGLDLARIGLETRDNGRRLLVSLPPPRILEISLEDAKPDDYPYPDIKLNPAAWRDIAEFIESRIGPRLVEEGILEAAAAGGEDFLRALFSRSGFHSVEFLRKPPDHGTGDPPSAD